MHVVPRNDQKKGSKCMSVQGTTCKTGPKMHVVPGNDMRKGPQHASDPSTFLNSLDTNCGFTTGLSLDMGLLQPLTFNLKRRRVWSGLGEDLGASLLQ